MQLVLIRKQQIACGLTAWCQICFCNFFFRRLCGGSCPAAGQGWRAVVLASLVDGAECFAAAAGMLLLLLLLLLLLHASSIAQRTPADLATTVQMGNLGRAGYTYSTLGQVRCQGSTTNHTMLLLL